MERESNPMQPMCRSGCGFYGNPATDGLCSVCFKDALRKKQQPPVSSTPATASSPVASNNFNQSSVVTATTTVSTSSQTFSNNTTTSTQDITTTAQPTVQTLLHNTTTETPNKDKLLPNEESGECSAAAEPNNQDEEKDSDKDAKKKKNRCVTCRKKVGLTGEDFIGGTFGFECRCGGLFCAIHRYSDKHDCTFDYREHGAAEIRRNNPVVVGEKIQKI